MNRQRSTTAPDALHDDVRADIWRGISPREHSQGRRSTDLGGLSPMEDTMGWGSRSSGSQPFRRRGLTITMPAPKMPEESASRSPRAPKPKVVRHHSNHGIADPLDPLGSSRSRGFSVMSSSTLIDAHPPPPVSPDLDEGACFEKSFMSLVDRLQIPIEFVNGFQVLWANRAHVEMMGHDTLSAHLDKINSNLQTTVSAPMRQELIALRQSVQVGLQDDSSEMAIYPDEGPPANYRVYSVPINFDLSGYYSDVSELKGVFNMRCFLKSHDSEEPSADEQRARQGFMHTSAMVSLLNVDGHILLQNPAAAAWWTSPEVHALPEYVDGNKLRALFGSEFNAILEAVERFEVTKMRFEVLPRTWHMITAVGSKDPVTGETIVIVNQDDVTAMQDLEEARKETEIARGMVERKDMLFANVSHELKTPLNGIIGLSSALLDRVTDDEHQKLLTSIQTSAQRLAALVGNLVDSAASQQGKLVVKQRPVDVTSVIYEVLELCASLVQPGVELLDGVTQALPLVLGDKDRITQVLTNLVGNALKVPPFGSGFGHLSPLIRQAAGGVSFVAAAVHTSR